MEIKSSETIDDEMNESVIRIIDNSTANDLLQVLMAKTEIRSFGEIIPSINDIFIR